MLQIEFSSWSTGNVQKLHGLENFVLLVQNFRPNRRSIPTCAIIVASTSLSRLDNFCGIVRQREVTQPNRVSAAPTC